MILHGFWLISWKFDLGAFGVGLFCLMFSLKYAQKFLGDGI